MVSCRAASSGGQGIETQKGEKNLALDLYEFLHDQGIDFHIEPHSTSGIPDFVADQVGKDRVIADTKLFWPERSKGKSYIISGFNQAYTYACDYNEPCAYLVIYKMCQEGAELPRPIHPGFISIADRQQQDDLLRCRGHL